jgi:hypothetical protein
MSKAQAQSLRAVRFLGALPPRRAVCPLEVDVWTNLAAWWAWRRLNSPQGHTASSTTVTGVKKRAGLTCWYPRGVATATTTIGMIPNACDLLLAVPS